VALSSGGDKDLFWDILEERMELCHKAHKERLSRLFGTVSDVAPILWQHGALARLKTGETIDRLIKGGYATVSLGYAGLYECVKYMTGHSHTDNAEGEEFGLTVMQKLNDACNKWKEEEDIDYSPYGSPIESTTYKFAKCLQSRFGKIEGITDRNYITNSYHVFVGEEINPFDKLAIESKFQLLSGGGNISYCESANMMNNVEALLQFIKYIYETSQYAEINTKSDYCHECMYEGEFEIYDNNGKLDWRCPNCGNTNHEKMNITRRVCGYLSTNFFNQGRTQEIKERYVHLDNHEIC
jgi:ribonucleoside-triphosphate reductase